MSLYSAYETDPKLETEGVWLPVGTNSKGETSAIRIRRAGGANQMFAKVFEFKSKPHRRLMDIPGALDQRVQERVMREVYAEAVVIGWENIDGRDGQPLEFTKENVLQLFTDLPDLFRVIVKESQDMALYRKEVREVEAGN